MKNELRAAVILMSALTILHGSPFAEPSARETFLDFAKAAGEKDVAKFKSFYSESFMRQADVFPQATRDKFFLSYMSALPLKPTIISEEQNGDKYTVRGEGQAMFGESAGFSTLVKENGIWKVLDSSWDFKPGSKNPVKHKSSSTSTRIKLPNDGVPGVEFKGSGDTSKNAGFIYISNASTGPAEKAVAITFGKTWTLSESSGRPGLYDRKIASGAVKEDGVLQDWPRDASHDKWVWASGSIKLFIKVK